MGTFLTHPLLFGVEREANNGVAIKYREHFGASFSNFDDTFFWRK